MIRIVDVEGEAESRDAGGFRYAHQFAHANVQCRISRWGFPGGGCQFGLLPEWWTDGCQVIFDVGPRGDADWIAMRILRSRRKYICDAKNKIITACGVMDGIVGKSIRGGRGRSEDAVWRPS